MRMLRKRMLMKRPVRSMTLILCALFIVSGLPGRLASSFYYQEDFSGGSAFSNRWDSDFRYGRDGFIVDNVSSSSRIITGNKLIFSGMPLMDDGAWSYHTIWVGRSVKLTNFNGRRLFNASEYEPFGFEVVRTRARMWHGNDAGWPEDCGGLNVWLIEENNAVESNWNQLDNFVFFYEGMRYIWGTRSRWGVYKGADSRCMMTNAKRPDSKKVNLTTGAYNIEFDYNGGAINQNDVGIRVTYNGSGARFYVNPDPSEANAYPNEYCFVRETSFSITNNLRVMLSHENNGVDPGSQEYMAAYTNILFRTICKTLTASVRPAEVTRSSLITYTNTINSSYSNTDSGIGELLLVKPAGFSKWSNIQVLTNGAALTVISAGSQVNAGQVLVTTNSNNMKIRFLQNAPAAGGAIKNNSAVIRVLFTLTAPSNTSPAGLEFKTYADCVKYNYTGYSLWATTGRKRAYPSSSEAMLVKVYNQPRALASITPNSVYEGTGETIFTYRIATSAVNDGPHISRALIEVPAGFNVYRNEIVSSLISTNFITVTNGNDVLLKYRQAGTFLPSRNGIDQITVKAHDTAPDGLTAWPSLVESVIVGSSPQYTETNAVYPSQQVLVKPEKPKVFAYVLPDHIYNISVTNILSYYLVNNGGSGNDVIRARITLPRFFTNAVKVSSDTVSTQYITYNKSTNYFLIDYQAGSTNIKAGRFDRVRIRVYDSIPAVQTTNEDLPSMADNGNGDGFVDCQEDIMGWQVQVVDPVAEGEASLFTNTRYTTDVTNSFTYRIFNSAVMGGNDLYMARIVIPGFFTNIENVRSSRITNDGNTNIISVKSNVIRLFYYRESTNAILRQGQLDTITFRLSDSMHLPTVCTLQSSVANSSNTNSFRVTGNYLAGNKALNLVHPDIFADAYILPGNLDATTLTNTMAFYVRNTGSQENDVKLIRVTVNTSYVTNVDNLTSSVITNLPGVNVKYIRPDILLRYENDGSPLVTGRTDFIRFRMHDKVLSGGTLVLSVFGSNVKHSQALAASPGQSLQVSFALPDPLAQGSVRPNVLFTSTTKRTDVLVYKVTNRGSGSNNLKKVKLFLAGLFKNKIISASNSWQPSQTLITIATDSVVLDYTNRLTTGSCDWITLVLTNAIPASGSNAFIQMASDNENGAGFMSGLTNAGYTRKVTYTKQPEVSIAPAWVTTTSGSNTFSYTIKNGNVGGLALKKAAIVLPAPLFVTNSVKELKNTWYTQFTVRSRASNWILLDYSARPLDPDNADIVTFNIRDTFITGSTSAAVSAYADYGDNSGWRETAVKAGGTNTVTFIMPPASAQADFSPKQVGTDDLSALYTLVLTNVGVSGNNIRMARIDVPVQINNVVSLTSFLAGSSPKFTNGQILINYQKAGTFLGVNLSDTIQFRGYDTVTLPASASWQVKAANTTNTNDLVPATALYSNSFDLVFVLPDYGSEFYITPGSIDTTLSVTVMTMFVKNKGGSGNNIQALRLHYPPVFTNLGNMTSTRATNITFVSPGLLSFSYHSTNFIPGRFDWIVFNAYDSLNAGNSNVSFGLSANFNTSGTNYISGDVVTGKSKDVSFAMPFPAAELILEPDEVYTTSQTNRLFSRMVNKGQGSHSLLEAAIMIPDYFTNQLAVTGSLATNWQRTGGLLLMKYDHLAASSTDSFFLSFVNMRTSQAGPVNFACTVSNGFAKAAAGSNSSRVSVVTPPSSYAEPSLILSTEITNTITLKLYNDGSGTSGVNEALIIVPWAFTNILSVQSAKLASPVFITNKRVFVKLDYASDANGALLDNESDTIILRTIDGLSEGTQTALWSVRADNGSGKAPAALFPGKSMRTFLTNPAPAGSAALLTRWVYNTRKSNAVRYIIQNEGEGSNNIKKAVIFLTNSSQITQIAVVESTHLANAANARFTVSSVTLYYELDANGALKPGETDTVTLGCIHRVNEGNTPEQYIPCQAFNWLGGLFLPVPSGYPEDSQVLSYRNMPEAAKAYIYGVNQAFTMNTNVTIRYKVENNSYDTAIEGLRIAFDTSNFSITSVDALGVPLNDGLMLDTRTNYFILDYSRVSNSIKPRQSDIITIKASYRLTAEFSFPMDCEVHYEGAPFWDAAEVKAGETNILWVKRALWGKITGRIVPDSCAANILLLAAGTEDPVYPHSGAPLTTDEKNQAISSVSVVSENNAFALDFIPAGLYDLKVSAGGYYNYKYKLDVRVYTNIITSAGIIELYSEPIDSSSLVEQKRRCINTNYDYVDILIIPTGSIYEDYIADIRAGFLTAAQQADVRKNRSIKNTGDSSDIVAFDIKLFNLNLEDVNIYGIPLGKEWTLNVPYDESAVLAKGWQEKDLAVYYWDELVNKWFKIGGIVNESGNYVSAKISFVSRRYAVLAENRSSSGKVYDVTVDNNPFTPFGSSGEYSRCKVNFRVEDFGAVSVEARIFNLLGEEMVQTKPAVDLGQGSFWWDGKDKKGNVAPGGTYLFQIRADGYVYTGAILLVR